MKRAIKALTDREIRSLAKTVGSDAVGSVEGLTLRRRGNAAGEVTSARWYLRVQGASKARIALGKYPEMGLQEAKAEALKARKALSEGINPAQEARAKKKAEALAKKEQETRALTVGDILDEWMAYKIDRGEWGKGIKSQGEEVRRKEGRRIRQNVPLLLGVSVATAEPEDVAKALESIWCARRATAETVCSHLHGLFHWAMTVKKCRPRGVNPAKREWIRPLLPSESKRKQEEHMPALEPEQLPHMVKALMAKGGASNLCMVMAILTCSRSENIREMRWDQLTDGWTLWSVDAIDMKVTANGQHKIPLSEPARRIIKHQYEFSACMDSEYVFGSDRNGGAPFSNNTLNVLIKRSHAQEVAAGREGWIDRAASKAKGRAVVAVQHGISRSTFKTWAVETHQDTRAVELILHHHVDPIFNGAYDRSEYLEPKRRVLEEWGKFCFSLCEPS